MRKSIALALTAATTAGLTALVPGTAGAADCTTATSSSCTTTVTAAVTSTTGIRTLGPVAAVTLTGAGSPVGSLVVPVTETAAQGVNPWYVTVSSSALTGAVSSASLPASSLTVADNVVPTTGGCLALTGSLQCTITGGGTTPRALSTAQTLFKVANESTSTAYTGTYSYTGNLALTVPNGTTMDTYSGTLTLTLVQ